ncbi:MAG: hypothetical protein ACLFWM_00885 [Actinomycetota bacterium]
MPTAEILTPEDRILRYLLGGVALAAGITGFVLLMFPLETGRYFSWGLDPPPLAALIGGSYLASLLVFGIAVPRPWVEVRGLVIGTLALTLPMLASTFTHLQVFDFGRWQAWGWVLLFLASPLCFGTVILRLRRRAAGAGAWPAPWAMMLAGGLAVSFLAIAVLLWIDPAGAAAALFPFDLPPLGGRVLGCWVSFLAFLSGWIATHTREESWIPALALSGFAVGALAGGIRTLGQLQPPGPYLAVLGILTLVGGLLLTETRRRTSH